MNIFMKNRRNVFLVAFSILYVFLGCATELEFAKGTPLPGTLFVDFSIYERTLVYALNGESPYAILNIGQGFLYPPSALFLVELFFYIRPFALKVFIYSSINILLLIWMVYGLANYYGYTGKQVWYWYVICMGFAPFLELLHLGQINIFVLFGLFLLFMYTEGLPNLGGFGWAMAVLTKVSPLPFLIYLFALRKWKTIAFAVSMILLILGLSVLRYGFNGVVEYPTVLMYITHQFPLFTNTQSLVAKVFWLQEYLYFKYGVAPTPLVYLAENIEFTQQLINLYIMTLILISAFLLYLGRQKREYLFMITALGVMLLPNVMWYHHYVFILLPLLIWMGFTRLNPWVTAWCLLGFLIIQIDRFELTYGLLIHIFSHITIWLVMFQQIKNFPREFLLQPISKMSS